MSLLTNFGNIPSGQNRGCEMSDFYEEEPTVTIVIGGPEALSIYEVA